jgi:hypothetical protein
VSPTQSKSLYAKPSAVTNGISSIDANKCDESVVIGYEDFESGSHGSWNEGVISYEPALTKFLGRLNKETNHVDNTYFVSPSASSVTVEFIMYEIGRWDPDDTFTIAINSRRINLGKFYEEDLTENILNYESGNSDGISWQRYSVTPAMDVAYDSVHVDQAHKVELRISPSYYTAGRLDIELRVNMNKSINNESAGIDNFKVTAHGLCFKDNLSFLEGSAIPAKSGPNVLMNENGMPYDESEKKTGNEVDKVETHHCSLKEFPCGDGQKVHICHHNSNLGYQTFCVSEDESDIVQFYANSYCGPCVGGFGGKWFHM